MVNEDTSELSFHSAKVAGALAIVAAIAVAMAAEIMPIPVGGILRRRGDSPIMGSLMSLTPTRVTN